MTKVMPKGMPNIMPIVMPNIMLKVMPNKVPKEKKYIKKLRLYGEKFRKMKMI
jgi:hypothetical protein